MTDYPTTSANSKPHNPFDFTTDRGTAREMSPPTSKATNGGGKAATKEVDHGEPGSSWKTKKFSEEYERAFNQLLDQKFNMGISLPFP
jgi:hypothetical protein